MTEIQTRLLRNGGPAVIFENPIRADGSISRSRPGQPVRHGQARGHGRDPGEEAAHHRQAELREVGELLAFLRQPDAAARAEGRLRDAAPGAHRHVDAAQCREVRRRAAGGAEGRPDRPQRAADPDLLARRAGAADHLAPGGHQGPVGQPRGRLQPRHLPHAGAGQGQGDHALAGPPRRRPALRPAQEGALEGAPARRHRARRRSGHHPGGRDAGAGHPVGIPVRRPAARRQGRPGPLQDHPADGPGPGRDRHRGPCAARRVRGRGPLRRPHRLLQLGRDLPGVPGHRASPCARTRST
jgi:hypothetical protein